MWRNDINYKYIFMFPMKNLARKGLSVNEVALKGYLPIVLHICDRESGQQWFR